MRLTLLFFAGLREALDRSEETVELPADVLTVAQLRHWLAARGGAWSALATQKNLRAALNQIMVAPAAEVATQLHDEAEVAFFPPVTGG